MLVAVLALDVVYHTLLHFCLFCHAGVPAQSVDRFVVQWYVTGLENVSQLFTQLTNVGQSNITCVGHVEVEL